MHVVLKSSESSRRQKYNILSVNFPILSGMSAHDMVESHLYARED